MKFFLIYKSYISLLCILGLLFLCMPKLWAKGFTHRKFQVVMIYGSEIMTISIFEKSLPTPTILNLQLFLPISIIKISVKAIMNPLFYWISKSFMVFGFSEWHLDFPKMLPAQGFWFPKGVPFLGIFLPDHISDAYIF